MGSLWEPPDRGVVEIEVEERPARGSPAVPRPSSATTSSALDSARRAARVLRVLAWFIASGSVLGYILLAFWEDRDGYYMAGESIRSRIGSLLMFVGTPLALAALVYATSLLVMLYAVRIELDTAPTTEGGARSG